MLDLSASSVAGDTVWNVTKVFVFSFLPRDFILLAHRDIPIKINANGFVLTDNCIYKVASSCDFVFYIVNKTMYNNGAIS